MTNSRIRVGVVGGGFMGRFHAQAIVDCPTAELAGIVDTSREVGEEAATAFEVPWFKDVGDALDAKQFDAYVVALPDTLHQDTTCRLLENGAPVLLEKPMAHTLDAAKTIAAAARKSGAPLLIGHVLRFDPRYAQAADLVRDGAIGEPVHGSSGRFSLNMIGARMNGTSSVCFYLGVHDVDALQWISGSDIKRVYSRSVSKAMPKAGVSSEDAILSTCELTNGMVGQLYFGWSLPDSAPTGIWARTEIVGTEGVIDLDVRDHGLRVLSKGSWSLPDGSHWPTVNGRLVGDLAEEILHFTTALQSNGEFVVPVSDALRAVAVNDAILRSVKSGEPEDVEDWAI